MTSKRAERENGQESSAESLWEKRKLDGSISLRNSLFEIYFPWCREVASGLFSKYHHYLVDWHDCVSVVSMATLRCIESFDPDLGVPFEAYAFSRVRGAVLNEIRSQVKHSKDRVSQDAEHVLFYEFEGEDRKSSFSLILDAAIEMAVAKLLEVGCIESGQPDNHYEKEQTAVILAGLTEKLSGPQKFVIKSYYFQQLSLKEIAEILDVSTARVSQLHRSGLTDLRRIYEKFY
jgi:RNA polymerase sigma factor for flagellar operon FliA